MKKLFNLFVSCVLCSSMAFAGNCPGDFNCDGIVSSFDLMILMTTFGSTGPGLVADMNCDQIVSAADLTAFLAVYGNTCPCAGDMDYDGDVDDDDLALVSNFAVTGCLQLDFNCDGVVDLADKQIFYGNLGSCASKRLSAPASIFNVFPNPTRNYISIQSDLDLNVAGIELTVMNYMGQQVASFDNQYKMDMSHLPSGTYFVQLRFQDVILKTEKFLKI